MKNELQKALVNAVKTDVANEKTVALLFSGGIDSTLIGKILVNNNIDVIAITVGTKNSEDVKVSQAIASQIFRKHIIINLTEDIVKKTVPKVIEITGKKDAITVSVGSVIYLASKYASMLGLKTIVTGAGSDEIFCGYSSHEKAFEKGYKEVQKECELRLKGITKDIDRDTKICKNFGLTVKTPFLNEKVIEIGMKMDPKEKISKDKKKIVLRKMAKEMDLPKIIYERKKKAAQYGSGLQKILKKLSKNAGKDSISNYLND